MESLPDRIYFKDLKGRFLAINKAHAASLGLARPEDAIGKSDFDFFKETLAQQKFADEQEIIRSGKGFVGKEERSRSKEGLEGWVMTSKVPLVGDQGEIIGTFGISRDITETKIAREALEAHHRLLETLIDILPCRIFIKDTEGRLRLTNIAYRQAVGLISSAEIEGRRLDEIIKDARTANTSQDDQSVLRDGKSILNREEYDASPLGDKRWMLLSKVPLRDGEGRVHGIVGMSADITSQKEAEARAVHAQEELAAKNQQIEAELAVARELQTELMTSSMQYVREMLDPTAPFFPKIAFHYEPCEYLAGDFFQAISINPRSFGLLLCDVMGHGVKAALVTTLIRGLLADVKAREQKPGQVLEQLNDRLCALLDRPPLPRFVTALYATVDITEGRISLASAGHSWPLYQAPGASPAPITTDPCGPALGLIRNAAYASTEHTLQHGDRLLLYTDGWTEEASPAGEEFGTDRLSSALSRHTAGDPAEVLATIAREIRDFAQKDVRSDDLCSVLAVF